MATVAGEPLKLTYRVRARRVGWRWELDAPGFATVFAKGRDLETLASEAADALADTLQLPRSSFDVVIDLA